MVSALASGSSAGSGSGTLCVVGLDTSLTVARVMAV